MLKIFGLAQVDRSKQLIEILLQENLFLIKHFKNYTDTCRTVWWMELCVFSTEIFSWNWLLTALMGT